jgi:hypothetical protein
LNSFWLFYLYRVDLDLKRFYWTDTVFCIQSACRLLWSIILFLLFWSEIKPLLHFVIFIFRLLNFIFYSFYLLIDLLCLWRPILYFILAFLKSKRHVIVLYESLPLYIFIFRNVFRQFVILSFELIILPFNSVRTDFFGFWWKIWNLIYINSSRILTF